MLLTSSIINRYSSLEVHHRSTIYHEIARVDIMRPEITGKKVETIQASNPMERLTYTIDEAAKMLGICRALAYRRGVLPTVQIAGRRLVPRQALAKMLAEAS